MKSLNYHRMLAVVVLFGGGVSTTHAAFIENNFGLSSSHSTITFDEHVFPSGSGLTTEYADLGVIFLPYAIYYPGVVQSFWPNGPAPALRTIEFTQAQTGAAFEFATYGGTQATFQALLGGSVVESGTTIIPGTWGNYYGFDGISFDSINIYTNNWPAWVVDNIQLPSAVPEPATSAMMIIGLAMIARRLLKRGEVT